MERENKMIEIDIRGDYIKLGQLLKLVGAVSSGSEAKEAVGSGKVFVNHEPVFERGKKLHSGDLIHFENYSVHLN